VQTIENTPAATPLTFWLVAKRGLSGMCPNCGQGKLFARYLKQVQHCSVCGEEYEHIRADDGPAWLTILIVGHVLAPILLFAVPGSSWPDWVSMLVWPVFAFILALVLLPRCKGLFIAVIWRNNPGNPAQQKNAPAPDAILP
jgi:uncharacterized protein (DUF983 family)